MSLLLSVIVTLPAATALPAKSLGCDFLTGELEAVKHVAHCPVPMAITHCCTFMHIQGQLTWADWSLNDRPLLLDLDLHVYMINICKFLSEDFPRYPRITKVPV